MPVTFKIANHPSKPWLNPKATSIEDLFAQSCPTDSHSSSRIIQSSLPPPIFQDAHITPSQNGFVYAAFDAYSHHHHLTIRPDDLWFAILSQLSVYINAHAESLRSHFVAHKGKKELVIKDIGSIETVDFGVFARRMTALMQANVKDPDLRDWIMPTFTTTQVDDRTTAAVLMMSSLQAYFSFTCSVDCGIPSVTLLGDRADYEDIFMRLDKLDELGHETKDWADLLRPVVAKFVATFDDAMATDVKDFWAKIAHWQGGSVISLLSGWLTAFCFWRNDGESLHHGIAPKFDDAYVSSQEANVRAPLYALDGVSFHSLDTDDIPNGFASVPVKVDDNGCIYRTKMVAGSLGISVGSSGERELDSLRSLSGWVMYELNKVE
jgi:hypothetical protein